MDSSQLIWTTLYNPERTPAHWTKIVREGQFVVFIADAVTGAARDAEGRPFLAQEGSGGPAVAICDSEAAAAEFARKVTALHPQVRCEIYDHEGKAKPPITVVYDASVRDRFVGKGHARRQLLIGAGFVAVGSTLAVIDLRSHMTFIWGYIVGLKCLVLGGTFVTRGLLELREQREK